MDKITIFGTLLAVSSLLTGLKLGGGDVMTFLDFPSVLVVFGGSLGTIWIAFSRERIVTLFGQIRQAYRMPADFDYLKIVGQILGLSDLARRNGVLSLDKKLIEIENPFLQRGLQMAVDGIDAKVIEDVMTAEIHSRAMRHADVKASIDFYASVVPSFGLIGTILGLVTLLRNMDDPSTIGSSMALALLTTLYGALAANMFLLPLGRKIEERSNNEQLYGELILRGCLLIAAGSHPRIVRERMLALLPGHSRLLLGGPIPAAGELKKGD
ncbi:MotA/TolQ/ExbB proton channel family protein [Candidatus Ozemobacteraceae bacterium]|nr:MotA/TolQ/ExbB proton channel family protein [Candidatus Ozemobacteraceae bacterium]